MQNVAAALGYGQPLHLVIYAVLIIFFCFFYTALVFNARDTADNLKKSGAFVRGIRPGQQTAEYIDHVLTRLTLWGALYVTAVCLLPEILISWKGVPFHFGGTSLLIVVVVVMDFMSQLNAHMMSHHYPGLLKKANLLGYGRSGFGWLIMKVRPSVKKICKNCKIVRRRRVVYVICYGPASQAASGLR